MRGALDLRTKESLHMGSGNTLLQLHARWASAIAEFIVPIEPNPKPTSLPLLHEKNQMDGVNPSPFSPFACHLLLATFCFQHTHTLKLCLLYFTTKFLNIEINNIKIGPNELINEFLSDCRRLLC